MSARSVSDAVTGLRRELPAMLLDPLGGSRETEVGSFSSIRWSERMPGGFATESAATPGAGLSACRRHL